MTDFEGLLKVLNDAGVQFILVGGIHVKMAAGRKKDLAAIAELEVLLEERNKREKPT